MRVLLFDLEQYVDFENEALNLEVRLPILNSGAVTSHADFVYQRVLIMHGPEVLHQYAIKESQAFQPDVLVFMPGWYHQCPKIETLREIQSHGVRIFSFISDSMRVPPDYELDLFHLSDGFCIANSFSNYCRYRYWAQKTDTRKSILFSAGHHVFTDFMRPMEIEKSIDVLVLGSMYGRRVDFTRKLQGALAAKGIGLHVLGGNFHDLPDSQSDNFDPKKGAISKRWIPWPQYLAAINSSKICLCPAAVDDRDVLNGKIFEFVACNAFTLTERNKEIELLAEGSGLTLYDDLDGCFKIISDAMARPNERNASARLVHDWYLRSFDYRRFWAEAMRSTADRRQIAAALPHLEERYQSEARRFAALSLGPGSTDWERRLFETTPAYAL